MNLQNTYKDMTEIGSGGGGTVFRAYHTRMEKYVVLKKIHDQLQGSVDIRGELDILKNLHHSYLPPVLDFIEDDGNIYTVMDYIPGESFESLLNKGVRFSQAKIAKYAKQLGEVLQYLHSRKPAVVHGDIKPANIILTPEDNICLIDFNISQVKSGTYTPNLGYTPGYAAPEQVSMVEEIIERITMSGLSAGDSGLNKATVLLDEQGRTVLLNEQGKTVLLDESAGTVLLNDVQDKTPLMTAPITGKVDERSDIYSVGATLYELLFGVAPGVGHASRVLTEQENKNCSDGLAYLINRCMETQPQKRFQTAAEYLKTVNNIPKFDRRYKSLVLRQNIAIFLCIVGCAICIIIAGLGRERLGREQVAAYNTLISDLDELRIGNGNRDEFEAVYNHAKEMFPEYADAYYRKALFMYEHREYSEMTAYISDEVLWHSEDFSEEEISIFYFLLANGYLEQGDLNSALMNYQIAVRHYPYDGTYYADYAIALARSGDLEQAAETLAQAEAMGGPNDKILLAQGEIKGMQGMSDEAAMCFEQCVEETEDAYIRFRAYMLWGELYDREITVENLSQKAMVLEEGVESVIDEYRVTLLELLAQTYIDWGDLAEDDTKYRLAIEKLQMITDLGWDTYVTHNNIGILHETIGEYELSKQEFTAMLSLYGEDYRTYKRLAFLEMSIQSSKDNEGRSYDEFLGYYNAAKELFSQSAVQTDLDMEMQLLDQVYDQLVEANWL